MTSFHPDFDNRTSGATVGSEDFGTAPLGTAPVYVDHGGGDIAVRFSSPTTTSIGVRTGFSGTRMSVAMVLRIVAVGTTATEAFTVRDAGKAGSVLLNTNRTIAIRADNDAILFTSTAIPLDTDVIVRAAWSEEATLAAGRLWGKITSMDGTTVYGEGLSTTAVNSGVPYTSTHVGKLTGGSGAGWQIDVAEIYVVDDAFADGMIDPELALANPPVVSRTVTTSQTVDMLGAGTATGEVDYTASSNVTSVSVTSATGPAGFDTGDVIVTGLVLSFADSPDRTVSVVLGVSLTGPGGVVTDTVTIPPGFSASLIGGLLYWSPVSGEWG